MFPTPATVRWSRIAALIGARRPSSSSREVLGLVGRSERLAADARVDVRVDLGRLEQQPRAEAADVAVGDVRPVV